MVNKKIRLYFWGVLFFETTPDCPQRLPPPPVKFSEESREGTPTLPRVVTATTSAASPSTFPAFLATPPPSDDDLPGFRIHATLVWYQSRVRIGPLIRSVLGVRPRRHRHLRLVVSNPPVPSVRNSVNRSVGKLAICKKFTVH